MDVGMFEAGLIIKSRKGGGDDDRLFGIVKVIVYLFRRSRVNGEARLGCGKRSDVVS